MTTVLATGVDWIPHDVFQAITNKAVSIKDKVTVLEDSELLTAIVPSKSNPRKCAHAIAASVKTGSLNSYVTWLLTKKRKTGGINYSKAILHGLPNDKGRKPGSIF